MSDLSKPFSNNQIDKLGERLKAGNPSDEDLTMLSAYRNSFAEAANAVANVVRELSGLQVATRSVKTQMSIVAKLQREGIKQLSSMQDIGGCRVSVRNLAAQNALVGKLQGTFPETKIYDRVTKPNNGYRAKHVVVKHMGKRIEIQIRTVVQHQWALGCELAATYFGQDLKYGGGNKVIFEGLKAMSDAAALHEKTSGTLASVQSALQFLDDGFSKLFGSKK